MKDRKLWQDALDHVPGKQIQEAVKPKKKHKVIRWIGAVAAVLALVIFLQNVNIPMIVTAKAVSTASSPRIMNRPNYNSPKFDQWIDERDNRSDTAAAALERMDSFLKDSSAQFLSGATDNMLYSPINVYMGLAMLAECTAGNTRQQILELLGAGDTDQLRRQISALWETVYNKEQNQVSILANSLWLDKALPVNQETADALAYHYYASVYQTDLTAPSASRSIGAWLNNNTGGMLQDATDAYQLPDETILALYSTVYFQGRWSSEFDPGENSAKKFHALSGDITCTFMNARLRQMNYYWGEDFGAVHLGLKNGSTMWFFLPDEDKTVDDVLAAGEYLDILLYKESVRDNNKYMKVNLSIPKFDVSSTANFRDGLVELGVSDVFHYGLADFSGITEEPVFLTAANQSVRVCIDEEGVKAAAYFELPGAGAAMPPEEIIDFVLDRPFLFVITNDSIPMFAGVVNQP